LVAETRAWFAGPLGLAGAISSGAGILAARAMGADFAYVGSPFIATEEARAGPAQKQAIVDGMAADIVNSSLFTGVPANYLRGSIVALGLDPDRLPARTPDTTLDFGTQGDAKVWRDIWGAGQGIGAVDAVVPAADRIAHLGRDYEAARARLCA
jgi:nitronate monooxygenase